MKVFWGIFILTICLHLSGCASTLPKNLDVLPPPLQLDDKVLIGSPDTVTIASEFMETSTEAKRGMSEAALGGAAAGLEASIVSGLILFPPAAAALVGGGAVFGAVIGGVGGSIVDAMNAADENASACVSAKLSQTLEAAKLNTQIAQDLQKLLRKYSDRELPVQSELKEQSNSLYPKIISVKVDGKTFKSADRTTIVLQSTLLRRKPDGSVRSFGNIDYRLRVRPLEEWCKLSDEAFRQELSEGVLVLASRMSDMLLAIEADTGLDAFSNADCPSYSGLALISPPAFIGLQLEYVTVDTLNPVLSWEAFPRSIDMKNNSEIIRRVEAVVYDLQVWQIDNENSSENLIYSRIGIGESSHRIEDQLKAGTKYFWMVRPRFYLNGLRRTLPWSKLTYDTETCWLGKGLNYEYRFKTPK